jgi:glycosyltransferase involved in cell wall biosynthesis
MAKPRRILIVTPHYPPIRLGGTELRAHKLAKGMAQHGIDAQVFCVESLTVGPRETCSLVSDSYEGIRVHRLALTTSRTPRGFEYSFDNPLIEELLDKLIEVEQIDLVHLISGYLVTACAVRAAHRHNVPIVVTLTDYWFLCPRIQPIRSNGEVCGGPYSPLDCTRCLLSDSRRFRWPEKVMPGVVDWIWRILDKTDLLKDRIDLYTLIGQRQERLIDLLNAADAVTTPTNSLRSRFIRLGARDRFILSRHSLDFEQVDYSKATPKTASPAFRFGYIGQVQYIKGIDLAVDAFRQLSNRRDGISLAIWGQPPPDTSFGRKLSVMVGNLSDVKICGRYEPADLPTVMASIDMLIVPSRWPEIGPFVILEAFASRTPVIAANSGNMPELVEHGVNGLLFNPDDSADLMRQMECILADKTLYQRLLDGIPRVRTMGDEMAEILGIYSSVIDKRKDVRANAMA